MIARIFAATHVTHVGLAAALGGWTVFWIQALYRLAVVPELAAACLFFGGLALGALDQRLRMRALSQRKGDRNR